MADHTFLISDLLLLVFRAKNLAVDLLGDALDLELAALALSLDGAVTECFFDVFLDLRSHFFLFNDSIHLLLVGLNLSAAPDILEIDQVVHVGRCGLLRHLLANGDRVCALVGERFLFLHPFDFLEVVADTTVLVRDTRNGLKGLLELVALVLLG
jgi:hypothetical protein